MNDVKANSIATYIIELMEVDNLKLQKLLYYCQGIHLKLRGTPLFYDKIEAWKYGPIVPNVYHKYKEFGFEALEIIDKNEENIQFEIKTQEAIDMALEYYGEFTGLELVSRTHLEKPWLDVYSPTKNNEITIDAIKSYFDENIVIKNEK